MTPTQLARLLRPFKIRPRTIRLGGDVRKGYRRADLGEAFSRYLPSEPLHPLQRSADAGLRDSASRYKEACVTGREEAEDPVKTGVVTGVTAQEPGSSGEGDDSGWIEVVSDESK